MFQQGIKVVYGSALLGFTPNSDADVKKLLETLETAGIKTIDTAQQYGECETMLGNAGAADKFVIDTKDAAGFDPPGVGKDKIIERGHQSLEKIKAKKFDVFYLHAPPVRDKMAEALAGIDSLYKAGVFTRFGISNFPPEEVQVAYNHCKEQGYILPTVYQGNYNCLSRKKETDLFPILRKLGMAFYAYSPLAGGFLTKSKQQIEEGAGRFRKGTQLGTIYLDLYGSCSLLDALADWQSISEEEDTSRAELAYRWVVFDSSLKPEYGDAIVIGASRPEQITDTMKFLKKGPLSQSAVDGIDQIWKKIEHEAPVDNYQNHFVKRYM